MLKRFLWFVLLLAGIPLSLWSQINEMDNTGHEGVNTMEGTNGINDPNGEYQDGAGNRLSWGGRDAEDKDEEEEPLPVGVFQWKLAPRLGTIIEAENNDTVVHNFQNYNNTEGYTGQYSMLGNLGSPRLNRIYLNRGAISNLLFLDPLSFFRESLSEFRFTNTKSPITNLAYHKCGSAQNGEDRIRAYFASNINKISGIGFKLDYLYGRGFYNSSNTSMFGSSFFGYYQGEKYGMHAFFNVNHMKEAENGGIEDDAYITNPQSFPQKYGSTEIPVMLNQAWNRNHEQTFYFTQKANAGYSREIEVPDSLKPKMPADVELLMTLSDSLRTVLKEDSVRQNIVLDSLRQAWQNSQIIPTEYIPVTSFIHTLELKRLTHSYIAHENSENYYTNNYYGNLDNVKDETKALSLRNTLGVALREGFNKWAQMGISLFATHQLRNYRLPALIGDSVYQKGWTENDISIGSELSRTQGSLLHYFIDGELWLVGENTGDFKLDGTLNFNFHTGRERKDSLQFDVHSMLYHEKPGFYLRHYHSQSTWWDNSLDRQFRTRIDGDLRYSKTKTKLNVGFENITNYTYFGMRNTLLGTDSTSILPGDYSHNVAVLQKSGNVQVFGATLSQDLQLKILHWDNEISYQKSSDEKVLPLPDLSIYSNLYFLFHIAKVLRVQAGADVRYFTSYYAPDYAPSIQQFAVQDDHYARVKVGNYPIVNVYLNLHLKHCRMYVAMNHVNQGSGHYFWAPHHPINPRTFHLGLSWNFFN